MGLRDHIDFHNQEVIKIVEFAHLWSQESGHSLPEIFEYLRVVLKKKPSGTGTCERLTGRYTRMVTQQTRPVEKLLSSSIRNYCFIG